jgi:hypothetical protein
MQDLTHRCYFRAFRGNNRFGNNNNNRRNGFGGNTGRNGGFGGTNGKSGFGGNPGRNGFGSNNARTGFGGGDRRGGNGFTGGADRRGSGPFAGNSLKGKQPGGGLVKPEWEMHSLRPFTKNFYVPHENVSNRFAIFFQLCISMSDDSNIIHDWVGEHVCACRLFFNRIPSKLDWVTAFVFEDMPS